MWCSMVQTGKGVSKVWQAQEREVQLGEHEEHGVDCMLHIAQRTQHGTQHAAHDSLGQ